MTGKGLRLELFCGRTAARPIVVQRTDRLDARWEAIPPPPLPRDELFTARWSGWLKAPAAGRYTLGVECLGECRLWLDGKLVVDVTSRKPEPIRHTIQAEFAAEGNALRAEASRVWGTTSLRLFWSRAGNPPDQTVPPAAFSINRPGGAGRKPPVEE